MAAIGSIDSVAWDLWNAVPALLLGIVGLLVVALAAVFALTLLSWLVWWFFSNAERSVVERRNTIIPTAFTLFATLGAASASAVSLPTGPAFALTALVAGMMFVSSVLRQAEDGGRRETAAKVIGSVGVVLSPAIAVGYILSRADLGDLPPEEWFVLGGSALILVAGVVGAFVFRRQGLAPS